MNVHKPLPKEGTLVRDIRVIVCDHVLIDMPNWMFDFEVFANQCRAGEVIFDFGDWYKFEKAGEE